MVPNIKKQTLRNKNCFMTLISICSLLSGLYIARHKNMNIPIYYYVYLIKKLIPIFILKMAVNIFPNKSPEKSLSSKFIQKISNFNQISLIKAMVFLKAVGHQNMVKKA